MGGTPHHPKRKTGSHEKNGGKGVACQKGGRKKKKRGGLGKKKRGEGGAAAAKKRKRGDLTQNPLDGKKKNGKGEAYRE